MARSLIPHFFMREFPNRDFFDLSPFTGEAADISISEDEQHIFVEVPLPGVEPENIEVTFDGGVLCIKGSREEKEEDKDKKYYRKASSTFSYRVAVPGELNHDVQPEAECEHGVMRIAFRKREEKQPKRIEVKRKD